MSRGVTQLDFKKGTVGHIIEKKGNGVSIDILINFEVDSIGLMVENDIKMVENDIKRSILPSNLTVNSFSTPYFI